MVQEKSDKSWGCVSAAAVIIAAIIGLGVPFAERIAERILPPLTSTAAIVAPYSDNSPIATQYIPSQNTLIPTISVTVQVPTFTAIAPLTTNKTLPINADSPVWINTGVYIQTGQSLLIQASGKATTWIGNSVGDSYPDGNSWPCDESSCVLSGERYGALIGKIENGSPFLVGANYQSAVSQSGYLYLMMNDVSTSYSDNSGNYTVIIDIR